MLVFRLPARARLLVSVYGPGPLCTRLATFGRAGRAGVNRIPFSGTLFGRALAPGRYAVEVEAVRGSNRARIGRVLVVILPRDGREGGSRALLAPDCDTGAARRSAAALDDPQAAFASNGTGRNEGGVAGARASSDDDGPLLPNLPPLPDFPPLPATDGFSLPLWALAAVAVLSGLGAAALVGAGIRRRREAAGWD